MRCSWVVEGEGRVRRWRCFEEVMDVADLAEVAQQHICTVFHVAARSAMD